LKDKKRWIDETFQFPGRGKIVAEKKLDLMFHKILTRLPEGLEVVGDLDLEGCDGLQENKRSVLPYLFEKAKKGEITSLDLIDWPLEDGDLPDDPEIKWWYLGLRGCENLTRLPKELKSKWLDLDGCSGLYKNKGKLLSTLFDRMKRGEMNSLELSEWPLEDGDLPRGLRVGGILGLRECDGLTRLPEGLEVGESLDLEGCIGLTELPEGLKVGELTLEGCTGLTHLPKEMTVEGILFLSKDLHKQVKKDANRLKREGKIKEEVQYLDMDF